VERLQIELGGCLQGDISHRGPRDGLGDGLGIIEVVLLLAAERPHILGRHLST
jgi:hypothetical protein